MTITSKVCEDEKEWDNLLDRCPHGTVFHKWKFLKNMEKHSKASFFGARNKAKLSPLICFDKNKVIGISPLFFYDSKIIKFVSSPGNGAIYQGPLIVEEEGVNQMKRESNQIKLIEGIDSFVTKELKANLIRLATSPNLFDSRALAWSGYDTEPLYTYEINLEENLEAIWENFDKHLRYNIRKAEESNLIFTEGGKEDLSMLFSSIKMRLAEQGFKPDVAEEYLFDLYSSLYPENMRLFTVKQKEKYMTGIIVFLYKDKALLWIGTPKTHITGVQSNDFLVWNVIKWASENHYKILEDSGANTPRLCEYKSKFNPVTSIYFSCEKSTLLVKVIYALKNLIKKKPQIT